MPTYYLDSSALFKRYRSEPGTEVMDLRFRNKMPGESFVASEIITLEIESAAARAVATQETRSLIATFAASDLLQIESVPITTALLGGAGQAARAYGLRALDAIHLASALQIAEAAQAPFLFICSDKELLGAARSAALPTLDPAAANAARLLRGLR